MEDVGVHLVRGTYLDRNNRHTELDNIKKEIYDLINHNHDEVNRRIDNTEREVFSQLDSRLDKLENKLTDTIKNGCDPVRK